MDEESGQFTIEIREAFCRRCGECVEACPEARDTEKPVLKGVRGETARVAFLDNCILCFSCAEVCRARAISIQGVKRVPLAAQDAEVNGKVRGVY
jgi:NAD-dependent dihydropyrimidine dehydrogenase PreA subunit